MARIINGSLYVSSYDPTGSVPGEYTFTDAIFDNQADATGQGSLDIQVGFLVYVPAMDPNLMTPVPGVSHRYKITSIQSADGYRISATILWDEGGDEIDLPLFDSYAICCQDSPNLHVGLYASNDVYANLPAGIVESAAAIDTKSVIDSLGSGGVTGLQGVTGLPGVGSTGLSGVQGETGTQGETGLEGLQGVTGLQGTTGLEGIQGETGSQGSTGVQGVTGLDGLQGSTGIEGLQGETGLDGIQGTTGLQGETGIQGSTGLNGLQGVTGLQGEGVTGLQGVTGLSGASSSANELPLGVNYTNGIFSWQDTTMTASALDDTNKLLLAISPTPPNALSGSLVFSNSTKYNAILPTGLSSAWYQDGKVAGDSISDYVIDNTYNLASPNTTTDFKVGSSFAGDEGTVQHLEDNTVVASRDVVDGVGVTNTIEILSVATYNTIWRKANARINYTQTTEGYKFHAMKYVSTDIDQSSSVTKIWYDDQDVTPTFSTAATIVQNTLSSSRYLSGIRYYSTGDTFNISCAINDLANKSIRPTNPVSYSMSGINSANITINGSAFAYNDVYNMSVSAVAINTSNVYNINAILNVIATKPSGKNATSNSSTENRLVNTYSTTYSTNGNIYMVDEYYRWTLSTDFSVIPGNYSNPTGNWDSSQPLTNGNAILYNSVCDYPTINYTSGYLPTQTGTNYSTFSGNQVAVWAVNIGVAHSSMSIVFTGILYTAISAVGTGNLNFELRLPSESDWLDAGKAFGDGNGCRLGSSSGSTLNVSFGTMTSSNSSGVVFIRVTLRNTSAGEISRIQTSGT